MKEMPSAIVAHFLSSSLIANKGDPDVQANLSSLGLLRV